MKKNSTITSIIEVAFSNCTTILSGIIVGFLVPKMLSVAGYGMYKTFTLYVTYVGFFQLGIIDGIVLDYGNKNYDALERPLFRSYFKWYVLVHLFFAGILFILSFMWKNSDYQFILILLGVNMIALNFTGYFQQISQITQRFKEYSLRKIIQSTLNILVVFILFVIYMKGNIINYKYYVLAVVLVNIVLTIWYLYTYKDIVFGQALELKETKAEIFHLIKIGFPLLFANLCSTLILTVDRQFVNMLFDTESYAVYSFAYNMLSLVTVAMSAISTVLYPALKRTTNETMKDNFSALVGVILLLSFGAIAVYYPLSIFVTWFLPGYTASLVIFRIIFPGIAMSSAVTVVMHNYYKTLGKNLDYFKRSMLILLLSVIANGIAYMIFKTTISISAASVITMLLWYLYVEQYFVEHYQYERKRNLGYMLSMLICFYLASAIRNYIIGFIVYIVLFIVITWMFYKRLIKGKKLLLWDKNS